MPSAVPDTVPTPPATANRDAESTVQAAVWMSLLPHPLETVREKTSSTEAPVSACAGADPALSTPSATAPVATAAIVRAKRPGGRDDRENGVEAAVMCTGSGSDRVDLGDCSGPRLRVVSG